MLPVLPAIQTVFSEEHRQIAMPVMPTGMHTTGSSGRTVVLAILPTVGVRQPSIITTQVSRYQGGIAMRNVVPVMQMAYIAVHHQVALHVTRTRTRTVGSLDRTVVLAILPTVGVGRPSIITT